LICAGIKHRGYSTGLQRVITDFGADNPFAKVQQKLEEHYRITVPKEAPRTITLNHAAQIQKLDKSKVNKENVAQAVVITETDGAMVPIVRTKKRAVDSRKEKQLCFKEAKLTLAHSKGSITPVFAATMGNAKDAGMAISRCVSRVGINKETYIHGVGDGAPWIVNQIENQFGTQAKYLIDFYHVCEYLSAASLVCAKENAKEWTELQKQRLKENNVNAVLHDLKPYIEKRNLDQQDTPVRTCYYYLENRLDQLDYKFAIENDLPIGSGEIESAHRYIMQKRLKIQGAWWLEETAENMLALRVNRANDDWYGYWEKAAA